VTIPEKQIDYIVVGAGSAGCLQRGSKGPVLAGQLEKFYRMMMLLTFGGGTNQREIIGQAGLGMPRFSRRS
jgi:hypothetical protein